MNKFIRSLILLFLLISLCGCNIIKKTVSDLNNKLNGDEPNIDDKIEYDDLINDINENSDGNEIAEEELIEPTSYYTIQSIEFNNDKYVEINDIKNCNYTEDGYGGIGFTIYFDDNCDARGELVCGSGILNSSVSVNNRISLGFDYNIDPPSHPFLLLNNDYCVMHNEIVPGINYLSFMMLKNSGNGFYFNSEPSMVQTIENIDYGNSNEYLVIGYGFNGNIGSIGIHGLDGEIIRNLVAAIRTPDNTEGFYDSERDIFYEVKIK